MNVLSTTDSETNQTSPPKSTNFKGVPSIQELISHIREMLSARDIDLV